MKKIILLLIICCIVIKGCALKSEKINVYNDDNNKIQELKQKVKELEREIEQKDKNIEKIKQEQDLFPILSNLALEFVRGQTQGDIEKLKEVISDDISIIEEDSNIYGIYKIDDEEVKYQLFNNNKTKYQDMVIQGYGYYKENDSYVIHIREFYADESNDYINPPIFLNLYFKQVNQEWKVTQFDFDV